jgi:ribosome-binding factor A
MSRRTERVNDLIRDELSDMLLREMNDPRLGALISITRVEVSPDLSRARVFVSIMAEAEEQKQAMKALEAAAGFMHRELKKRLEMRVIPFLNFKLDDSIARGAEMLSLLNQVHEPEPGREQS